MAEKKDLAYSLRSMSMLVIPLFLITLCGCGKAHHYPPSLLTADSLCEVAPTQALAMLEEISAEIPSLEVPDQMFFHLLSIKAADKEYVTHTSDTLILRVVDYYEGEDDLSLLSQAYYYAGRVYSDMGEAPKAVDYFQKALDATPDHEYERIGLINSQIGYIQSNCSLFAEALSSFQDALDAFRAIPDTARATYCMSDMASTYIFMDNPAKALPILWDARLMAFEMGDSQYFPNIDNQLARTYYSLHRNDSALYFIRSALAHITDDTEVATISLAGDIYADNGMVDSAACFFRQLEKSEDVIVRRYAYRRLGDLSHEEGRESEAMAYYRKWTVCNDSADAAASANMVAKMHALYNYQKYQAENMRLSMANRIHQLNVGILAGFCFFSLLLLLFAVRFQKKRMEMLRLKLEKYQMVVKQYRDRLVHEQPLTEAPFKSTAIYRKICHSLQSKKGLDEETQMELVQTFNTYYPSFSSKLSELCHVSRQNYIICILIKLQFSPSDISLLTFKSKQAISSARQRMYAKAFGKKGRPEQWDEIIMSL